MTPLRDAEARRRIREDLAATLVVEAAAGTGKTTELVARIVALVRSGTAALSGIAAVTFTEKAAGELKLRLRTELERARAEAPPAEARRLEDALEALETAAVGTIHSLCADLLRERPVEARVDPRFEVLGEDEQQRLSDATFDAWFASALASPPEGVRRILRRRPRGRGAEPPRETLRRAGRDLVEHRDFDGAWRREAFDRTDALARVVARLGDLAGLPAPSRPDDWLAKCVLEVSRFVSELGRREAIRGRDEDGLEQELRDLAWGRRWTWRGSGREYAPGLARTQVMELRDAVKLDLDAFLETSDADLAAALHADLQPLVQRYEAAKRRAGKLDFLDLLLRTRDLVRDDGAARRELQRRFTHVLVDEFQDTDPLQAEILFLVAADNPATSDWQSARPAPGKLFVVGDPKQSIYRFRRADVAFYEDAKRRLVEAGASVVNLSTSFRSDPRLQAVVNAAFAPRMTGGTQASYVPLDAYREAVDQPAVVALPVPRPYGQRPQAYANEAIELSYPDAVGAFVEWLVRESGWTVSERDKAGRVPVAARHVCLLLKRFNGWGGDLTRPYVRALEARGIPHVLVGGRAYHAREEVQALRNALLALEWPDDELAVYATLRGPLFALTDEALLAYHARFGRVHPLYRPEPATLTDTTRPVAQALDVLGRLHFGRNRRPLPDTLARLLDATRAHAGVAIRPAGEQALANVLRVLDLARRFEATGATSFRAFVDSLEEAAERGDASEAPAVEEGSDGVRLMTAHRAKGLEFPVVILADPTAPLVPTRPSRFVEPARRLWAMSLAGCAPPDLRDHAADILRRDEEENVRLAYVAATRARDLLVVPAAGDAPLQGWTSVLNDAVTPALPQRSHPEVAPACPPFGVDTVLDRPLGAGNIAPVAPGLHSAQAGGQRVVWWDPAALSLGREDVGGLRQHELLREGGSAADGERAHAAWRENRAATLAAGVTPSLEVTSPTERSEATADAAPAADDSRTPEIPLETTDVSRRDRPRGKRFGTLVHAVLAETPLDATPATLREVALAQGRLLGSGDDEIAAAALAAEGALRHPLLRRAAQSADCRREAPLLSRLADGALLDGVADLVFRDADGWTVVDFKTDVEIAAALPRYRAQVRLYVEATTSATGEPARGVLLTV